MIHKTKHPLADQTVKITKGELAGKDYKIEDWWDRLGSGSWMHCDGDPPRA